jgi:hypothetical protein
MLTPFFCSCSCPPPFRPLQVLEDNYRYKMKYSPDYQGVDTEAVSGQLLRVPPSSCSSMTVHHCGSATSAHPNIAG